MNRLRQIMQRAADRAGVVAIVEALDEHRSVSVAASHLGVDRSNLRRYMRRFGIRRAK